MPSSFNSSARCCPGCIAVTAIAFSSKALITHIAARSPGRSASPSRRESNRRSPQSEESGLAPLETSAGPSPQRRRAKPPQRGSTPIRGANPAITQHLAARGSQRHPNTCFRRPMLHCVSHQPVTARPARLPHGLVIDDRDRPHQSQVILWSIRNAY
jgi:hypothetical protein